MFTALLGRGISAVLLGSLLVLAGCSGSDQADPDQSAGSAGDGSSVGASPVEGNTIDTTSAYPSGVPASITLTAPGTHLEVDQTAKVAFTPKRGSVGVVSLAVTKIEHTTFKNSFQGWKLEDVRDKNPYFVHVTVRNIGRDTISSDALVPLYALNDSDTLVMYSTFGGTFTPCAPGAFPEKFKPGQKANLCLVYLMPDKGEMVGVAFRHNELFDPIVWTGDISERPAPKSDAGKKSGTKSGDKAGNKNGKNDKNDKNGNKDKKGKAGKKGKKS